MRAIDTDDRFLDIYPAHPLGDSHRLVQTNGNLANVGYRPFAHALAGVLTHTDNGDSVAVERPTIRTVS